jgi:hypothetical protein
LPKRTALSPSAGLSWLLSHRAAVRGTSSPPVVLVRSGDDISDEAACRSRRGRGRREPAVGADVARPTCHAPLPAQDPPASGWHLIFRCVGRLPAPLDQLVGFRGFGSVIPASSSRSRPRALRLALTRASYRASRTPVRRSPGAAARDRDRDRIACDQHPSMVVLRVSDPRSGSHLGVVGDGGLKVAGSVVPSAHCCG